MKILHVIFSLNLGGSETMLVDILNEQFKTNQVELIIINKAYDRRLISGVNSAIPIHLVNRIPGSRHPGKVLRFNYLLFRIRPDVIHFHDQNAINILALKTAARTCLTIHDVNQPTENLRKYDRLFSISEAVRLDILSRSKYRSDLVYNGIQFSKIRRKQHYELHDRLRMVQVGRLYHEKKGQDILLKSLSAIVHRYGVSGVSVDFVGVGPSLSYLQELAAQLGVTAQVRFLGGKDRDFIYRHLMDYDLLIQPSIYEGFGISVIEGIAAGLPVAASDVDGPSEIISSLPGGWLAEKGNPDALAKVILEIRRAYQIGEIETRCHASYQDALEKYSISSTVNDYLSRYGED